MDINTLNFGDASKSIACASIYVRFKRRNGQYSCQQVLSRSKLIPDGTTQPRAELCTALLNVHTGEIVRRSFSKYHKSAINLTDSQIVLHWISNDEHLLKQWIRNRVIEIRRFTNPEQWYYVQSKNMIADIGTRKGSTLEEVNGSSVWINGYEWMKKNVTSFPILNVHEINLSFEELNAVKKETPYLKHQEYENLNYDINMAYNNEVIMKRNVPDEVSKRYHQNYCHCYKICSSSLS